MLLPTAYVSYLNFRLHVVVTISKLQITLCCIIVVELCMAISTHTKCCY